MLMSLKSRLNKSARLKEHSVWKKNQTMERRKTNDRKNSLKTTRQTINNLVVGNYIISCRSCLYYSTLYKIDTQYGNSDKICHVCSSSKIEYLTASNVGLFNYIKNNIN